MKLESAVGCITPGVDYTLWNTFVIEMTDLV